MLHILWLAVKFIGMLLALILAILLVAAVLVLFCPLRYRVKIRKTVDEWEAQTRASWLFGLIRVTVQKGSAGGDTQIRINEKEATKTAPGGTACRRAESIPDRTGASAFRISGSRRGKHACFGRSRQGKTKEGEAAKRKLLETQPHPKAVDAHCGNLQAHSGIPDKVLECSQRYA